MRKQKLTRITFLASLTIGVPTLGYSVPGWVGKETQKRVGDKLTITCTGEGPSLDIARSEAMNSCKTTAVEQVATEMKVKVLAVSSEQSSGVHQEFSKDVVINGLVCKPNHESVENVADSFKVWIQCGFDLKAAKVVTAPIEEPVNGKGIVNREALNRSHAVAVVPAEYTQSSTKRLIITSVPQCESVIIQGEKSRVVNCTKNPMTIPVEVSDTKLTLRAKGYAPKEIKISGGLNQDEVLNIIFD